ncbi:transaldolase family protein, partial [Enterococcus faecium]|uniref:transaldolase family protein n=1 Tax=Enterococcus faecium TaxID=1352 RepID=UPI003CC6B081
IKKLINERYLITGTAIYTELQGYLAINNGADFIAPYYNRMQNQGIDAMKVIDSLRTEFERTQSPTKILAASFKNCDLVTTANRSGAHGI